MTHVQIANKQLTKMCDKYMAALDALEKKFVDMMAYAKALEQERNTMLDDITALRERVREQNATIFGLKRCVPPGEREK